MAGYSDPINHAFAFAAKHHDQQVRKGTRYPYLTAAPNVAVILARYGQDDQTLVAGILHDVVEDCVRDGYSTEMLQRRIGEKFGEQVLASVLSVTERRYDDEGIELSHLERKEDQLERLEHADQRSRWIAAANHLQAGGTLLADLRRTDFPESVWSRFSAGREATIHWYSRFHERLEEVGFNSPIMDEIHDVADALNRYAGEETRSG
ncbi:MAG TPA: HD domain-containing protein [Gemmatimonadaceae bacterium]|nr:HD domain-containing protein [Gemmatimonadaceae bacterium]